MESKVIRGSCLCGGVGFEMYPPISEFRYCHCPRCRKVTGSAFISNIFLPSEQFKWTKGEELAVRFDLPEAKHFATCFCKVCGSALPHLSRNGKWLIAPAGSLDDDPVARPQCSIWWDHRADWFEDINEIPRYPEKLETKK